jgi:hypothetical protein
MSLNLHKKWFCVCVCLFACRSVLFRCVGYWGIHENMIILASNQLDALFHVFIPSLCMFQASQCSSSGDRIALIHHLVWLVCVSDWLVCQPGGRHTKQSLTQTNNTRWCINPLNAELNPICHLPALLGGATIVVVSRLRVNTIRSPDDEHCDARNMQRDGINKYLTKCVKLVISKNL